MSNVKKQVRDAAIALLQGTSAKTVGVYAARVLETDEMPAVLVSVALERQDEPSTLDAQGMLLTLAIRLVGKASYDPDASTTVVDDLEVVEQQVHELLAWDRSEPDPLGLGVMQLYLDSVEEPEIDDEHEVPLAVIQVVYGIMLRVDRGTMSNIQ